MQQLIVHTTRQGEAFRTCWWTGGKEGASGSLTSRVADSRVPEGLKRVVAELEAMHVLIQAGRVGGQSGARGLRLVFSQPLTGVSQGVRALLRRSRYMQVGEAPPPAPRDGGRDEPGVPGGVVPRHPARPPAHLTICGLTSLHGVIPRASKNSPTVSAARQSPIIG